MYETFGKHIRHANPVVQQYNDLHQDIFWYLLQQTHINQCAGPNSLREFLIRYLLITKHPLHETAEAFIDEGLLISGRMESNPSPFP